ncbi:MAG: DNA-processing protein DprA [Oscillospiraceae bacterium]|nr:DNA-processing protein DprA [Oscillospiraceae bacterium]
MLVHWIWLAARPGLNDREKVAVLEYFSDPEAAFYAPAEAFGKVEGLSSRAVAALADKNLSGAEEILQQCSEKQIHICTYRDGAYPAKLKNIPDPPVVLYYKGVLPDLDGHPVIGVVGTRECSGYGISTAQRLGYQIAACGAVVVSGAAKGIDTAAMTGAMTAGGKVVGVLGSGVDVVYPASARQLYRDTEQAGCLVSEFPPGTAPLKWNFPKRNRIISGLSCGILVVEAPEESGALITARQAAEQGRDVFVVPGNIDMPSFTGSNALLREGAIMAGSGWDVVGEYQTQYPDKVHKNIELPENVEHSMPKVAQKPASPAEKKTFDRRKEKITVDKKASCAYSDVDSYRPASPDEAVLLEKLGKDTWQIDELIAGAGLPTGKILSLLTLLEIKGVVERLQGQQVRRKNKP